MGQRKAVAKRLRSTWVSEGERELLRLAALVEDLGLELPEGGTVTAEGRAELGLTAMAEAEGLSEETVLAALAELEVEGRIESKVEDGQKMYRLVMGAEDGQHRFLRQEYEGNWTLPPSQ